MKKVKTRDPEHVAVNLDALPDHETDALCRTLIGGVKELFKDPAVQADFKRWQQERQQKLKGATTI